MRGARGELAVERVSASTATLCAWARPAPGRGLSSTFRCGRVSSDVAGRSAAAGSPTVERSRRASGQRRAASVFTVAPPATVPGLKIKSRMRSSCVAMVGSETAPAAGLARHTIACRPEKSQRPVRYASATIVRPPATQLRRRLVLNKRPEASSIPAPSLPHSTSSACPPPVLPRVSHVGWARRNVSPLPGLTPRRPQSSSSPQSHGPVVHRGLVRLILCDRPRRPHIRRTCFRLLVLV